jgi:hypothetical protein
MFLKFIYLFLYRTQVIKWKPTTDIKIQFIDSKLQNTRKVIIKDVIDEWDLEFMGINKARQRVNHHYTDNLNISRKYD